MNKNKRIVASTIAHHIHDLMAEKVKKYMKDLLAMDEPVTTSGCDKFIENNKPTTIWRVCIAQHASQEKEERM